MRYTTALVLAALGCSGGIGDVGDSPGAPASTGGPGAKPSSGPGGTTAAPADLKEVAPARVRRLTAVEVVNSIRDVFYAGKTPAGVTTLPPEALSGGGFDNAFERMTVPLDFMQSLQELSEDVGNYVAQNLATLLPCDVAAKTEDACVRQFVSTWALRVFRRPPTADQTQNLIAVFQAARKVTDFPHAVGTMVEAMLQSPAFLFRTELGARAAGAAFATLTPWEVASALSYFFWRSTPDDALLQAAGSGALATPDGIKTEAQRLVADRRAKDSLRTFFFQWLDIGDGDSNRKSDPTFDHNMWLSMTGELQRYLDDVVWAPDGTLDKLYTATQTYADKRIAALYGIQPPAADGSFAKATVDPRQRAGFLTQPAWIASHTGGMEMTPVPPGAAVRKGLLCQVLPDPPPNVPKPSQDKSTSVRERFRAHSADPACTGCHMLIDPIGNGFENFDVMGRYRDKDAGGFALTGAGALTSTDADGPFTGAPELARKLAASTVGRECFAAELLEYLTGRSLAREDRRLQVDRMSVAQVIAKAGSNVKAAALGLVQSPAFLLRDQSHIAPGGNP